MSVTDFIDMPLKLLSIRTAMAFCESLDIEKPMENDYRALREYLQISFAESQKMEREVKLDRRYPSITMRLFCLWAAKPTEEANVQTLIDFVEQIDRRDVYQEIKDDLQDDLEKAKLMPIDAIEAEDAKELWRRIEFPNFDERLFSADLFNPGKIHDVLISYNHHSENDRQWMEKIRKFLSVEGLTIQGRKIIFSVVVGANDFFPGVELTTAYTRAIRFRCKRVILLISDSFKKSEECVFQMQIARGTDIAAYRRRVIPVLLENTSLPDEIFNIHPVTLHDKARVAREMEKLAISLI